MKAPKKAVKYLTTDEPGPSVNEALTLPIQEIGAFEAKTHLSAILDKVANGASFYITKRGKKVAEIRPIVEMPKRPIPGLWRGRIWMADDFDAPLEDFKEYME